VRDHALPRRRATNQSAERSSSSYRDDPSTQPKAIASVIASS
jgi:hypothetical protein